jgi:hypothetical protein
LVGHKRGLWDAGIILHLELGGVAWVYLFFNGLLRYQLWFLHFCVYAISQNFLQECSLFYFVSLDLLVMILNKLENVYEWNLCHHIKQLPMGDSHFARWKWQIAKQYIHCKSICWKKCMWYMFLVCVCVCVCVCVQIK